MEPPVVPRVHKIAEPVAEFFRTPLFEMRLPGKAQRGLIIQTVVDAVGKTHKGVRRQVERRIAQSRSFGIACGELVQYAKDFPLNRRMKDVVDRPAFF